jgi:probable F420-dependent oxidoreductase
VAAVERLTTDFKVRFGFTSRGSSDLDLAAFPQLIDDLERLRFDSIWIPEIMLSGGFDPIVALTHAAARTSRLKVGTHLVLPGRAPVRIARELANLDVLSGGRVLLTMVLGLPAEQEVLAQGVIKSERGKMLDEMVPLLRRMWAGETVNHDGDHFTLREAQVMPRPIQQPLEMWFGGQAPAAIRRAGRLADGYLPGLVTPTQGAALREEVQAAAADAGREIDPEHFGINLAYSRGPLSPEAIAQLRPRIGDADPADFVPSGPSALQERIAEWVENGYSKFLLRPVDRPDDWTAELETLAADVLHLQS